jgi:hypothetical protein
LLLPEEPPTSSSTHPSSPSNSKDGISIKAKNAKGPIDHTSRGRARAMQQQERKHNAERHARISKLNVTVYMFVSWQIVVALLLVVFFKLGSL